MFVQVPPQQTSSPGLKGPFGSLGVGPALFAACSLSLTPRCLLPPLELELQGGALIHLSSPPLPRLCMTSTHRLTHPLPSPSLPFTHTPCPVPVVGKEAGSNSVPLCVVLFSLNTLEGEHLGM